MRDDVLSGFLGPFKSTSLVVWYFPTKIWAEALGKWPKPRCFLSSLASLLTADLPSSSSYSVFVPLQTILYKILRWKRPNRVQSAYGVRRQSNALACQVISRFTPLCTRSDLACFRQALFARGIFIRSTGIVLLNGPAPALWLPARPPSPTLAQSSLPLAIVHGYHLDSTRFSCEDAARALRTDPRAGR